MSTTLAITACPETPGRPVAPHLDARSPAMRRFWDLAARAAPVSSTVLILGESGVGKEVAARWIHQASSCAEGPFVPVNCAAVPEALLESVLFGHARGAFTGALQHRAGVFEAAEGGTLFLDEIGDISPAMQGALLRATESGEIMRIGETRLRRVRVRLIAATNRDLRQAVAQRRFREDLYYRLCVIDLHVPPLRERVEDLPVLIEAFLRRTADRRQRSVPELSAAVWARLRAHEWPGNVRELEHAIERACAVARGPVIEVDDLPGAIRPSPRRTRRLHGPDDATIRDVVQQLGSLRRAAVKLDISFATLKRRLRAMRDA